IEPVAILQAAKVNVTPAIAIDITASHTRAIQPDLILGGFFVRQDIGKVDPGEGRREKGEAGFAFFWDRQGCRTKTVALDPVKIGRAEAKTNQAKSNTLGQ